MYHKYHTKGLVLYSAPTGEASKAYFIFTSELGLVKATARSVRKHNSKLKSALTDYSYGDFTFIKGRQGWKLTDAIVSENVFFSLKDYSKLLVLTRLLLLIRKLIPEEETNRPLFDDFISGLKILLKDDVSDSSLKNLECLMALRILGHLGYLSAPAHWADFVYDKKLDTANLNDFSPFRREAVKAINRSLEESQLV